MGRWGSCFAGSLQLTRCGIMDAILLAARGTITSLASKVFQSRTTLIFTCFVNMSNAILYGRIWSRVRNNGSMARYTDGTSQPSRCREFFRRGQFLVWQIGTKESTPHSVKRNCWQSERVSIVAVRMATNNGRKQSRRNMESGLRCDPLVAHARNARPFCDKRGLILPPSHFPIPVKKVSPQTREHLTQKPVELAVRAMQYSSKIGDNVLDLFGVSGSTLIGAEQTGRNAFLMELDPPYCDVIVDRYQRFTGKPAILKRTGESPIPMKPREEKMR